MARTRGSRNADYEATRAELLGKLGRALTSAQGAETSFREMAAAAGISTATLRHYFGDRTNVIRELLVASRQRGADHLSAAAYKPIEDVRKSLSWLLESVVTGWQHGVGAIHSFGLTAGLGDEQLGPAYVDEILEPTLQATEARIARHVAEGDLGPCNVRHAALELMAPVVLGLLHQRELSGARCRPLDLKAFLSDHLDRFLRAHAPTTKKNP